jgi:hypothetical protein
MRHNLIAFTAVVLTFVGTANAGGLSDIIKAQNAYNMFDAGQLDFFNGA